MVETALLMMILLALRFLSFTANFFATCRIVASRAASLFPSYRTYRELASRQAARFTGKGLGCISVLICPVETEIPDITAQPGSQRRNLIKRVFCALILEG